MVFQTNRPTGQILIEAERLVVASFTRLVTPEVAPLVRYFHHFMDLDVHREGYAAAGPTKQLAGLLGSFWYGLCRRIPFGARACCQNAANIMPTGNGLRRARLFNFRTPISIPHGIETRPVDWESPAFFGLLAFIIQRAKLVSTTKGFAPCWLESSEALFSAFRESRHSSSGDRAGWAPEK